MLRLPMLLIVLAQPQAPESPFEREAWAWVQQQGEEIRRSMLEPRFSPEEVRARLSQARELIKASTEVPEPLPTLLRGVEGAMRTWLGEGPGAQAYRASTQALGEGLTRARTPADRLPWLEARAALATVGGQPDRGWTDEALRIRVQQRQPDLVALEARLVAAVRNAYGDMLEPPDRPAVLLRANLLAEVWLRGRDGAARTRLVLEHGLASSASGVWRLVAEEGDAGARAQLDALLGELDADLCLDAMDRLKELVKGLRGTELSPSLDRLFARMDKAARARWREQPWMRLEARLQVADLAAGADLRADLVLEAIEGGARGLDVLEKRGAVDLKTLDISRHGGLITRLARGLKGDAGHPMLRQAVLELLERAARWREAEDLDGGAPAPRRWAAQGRWADLAGLPEDEFASHEVGIRIKALVITGRLREAREAARRLVEAGSVASFASMPGWQEIVTLLQKDSEGKAALGAFSERCRREGLMLDPVENPGVWDPDAPRAVDPVLRALMQDRTTQRPDIRIRALQAALRAVRNHPRPTVATLLERLAEACMEAGRHEEADEAIEKAATLLEQGEGEHLVWAARLRGEAVGRRLNEIPTAELERRLEALYSLLLRLEPQWIAEGKGLEALVPMVVLMDRQGRHGELLNRLKRLEQILQKLVEEDRSDKGRAWLEHLRHSLEWRAELG